MLTVVKRLQFKDTQFLSKYNVNYIIYIFKCAGLKSEEDLLGSQTYFEKVTAINIM